MLHDPLRRHPPAADLPPSRGWWIAGALFCLLMLSVHVAAGFNSAGITDFWRDMYWATLIAHGEALPLSGPPIYQLVELGPWWFYLLALPIWLTHSVVAAAVLIQILAAAKYVLAWRIGTRVIDARFGLACAIGMAIAGWSLAPLVFPSHPAVVETTLLLLALAAWRCWNRFALGNALLLGLAAAACLHAHPTTTLYVVVAATALLLRHRSWSTLALLGLCAFVVLASMAPPWFDSEPVGAAWHKTIAVYADHDLLVGSISRLPAFLGALFVGGAWSGLLLMTPLKFDAVRLVWALSCACVGLALAGVFLLRGRNAYLRRWVCLALLMLLGQILFLLCVRATTPIWMVPSCLPPLALVLALGWYAWLSAELKPFRVAGATALALYAAIALAPFGYFLRDVHSLRVMPHANPYGDIGQSENSYLSVPVPFVPARTLDAIGPSLCTPQTLHARLAHAVEHSLAVSLRNACGAWPDIFLGGAQPGAHVAGLGLRAAAATGIAADRSVGNIALYTQVQPIAPVRGGRSTRLQRMQVTLDAPAGMPAPLRFEFDAAARDVVSLTNRFDDFTPMRVRSAIVDGSAATLLYDDGGSLLYACTACTSEPVHWLLQVDGVEQNLDLVLLKARPIEHIKAADQSTGR